MGWKEWTESSAKRHDARRQKALEKLARGEKVGFAEQAVVREELAAQRRAQVPAEGTTSDTKGRVGPVTAATKLPLRRAKRIALLKTAAPGTDRMESYSMREVGKWIDEYAEAGWTIMSQSSSKPVTASFLNTDPVVTIWFRKT